MPPPLSAEDSSAPVVGYAPFHESHPRLLLSSGALDTPCRSPSGRSAALPGRAGPRSSGDRAPPSGGGSAGSNPAGGASFLPCGRSRRRCTTTARGVAAGRGLAARGPPHSRSSAVVSPQPLYATPVGVERDVSPQPRYSNPVGVERGAPADVRRHAQPQPRWRRARQRRWGTCGRWVASVTSPTSSSRTSSRNTTPITSPRRRPPGRGGSRCAAWSRSTSSTSSPALHGGQAAYPLERDRLLVLGLVGVEDVLEVQVAGDLAAGVDERVPREAALGDQALDVGRAWLRRAG